MVFEGDDLTPEDVAIQVFLKNRTLLEEKHAEQFLVGSRSFRVCVSSREPPRQLPKCPPSAGAKLESNSTNGSRNTSGAGGPRSSYFRVPRKASCGSSCGTASGMRREGTLDKGDREQNALIFHITPYVKGILELYRKGFGKHLFKNEDYFAADGNYTLQPLIDKGSEALDREGIDEIKSVSLHEIEIFLSKGGGVFYSLRGDDVFSYLEQSKARLPKGRWNKAVLSFELSDSNKARSVTVWPPSRASYNRDDDRMVVEQFLKKNQSIPQSHEGKEEGQ